MTPRSPRLDHRLSHRLRGWLHGSPSGLMALALVTGLGAGLGAIAFRALIAGFTLLFTGHSDDGAVGHLVHPQLPGLGIWFVVAVPVVGGLLYGPLIDRFAREARGHGVPEVMLAVAEQGGRIRPRVAVVKSLASAICLGAGGSVGREGPIVQIGSALGSAIGQTLRIGEANLRLMVACGAAGGISATFNAPIAGVFFALELILRDFEVRSFGAVVIASVTADVIGRAAFGSASFLPLPAFEVVSAWEYPLYAVLGLVAAAVGVLFVRTLYGSEDLLDRLWGSRPEWLRPVVGGIALGLLLLAIPQLYGVGYAPLEQAVGGRTDLSLLMILLAGKLLATSLTIGIGGSGGVFAPSLFMGGMLGAAFGTVANAWWPGSVAPVGAYGLVGMGAVFAGSARAPITAVLILFELTGDYKIILPLMLAIAVSAGVSSVLASDTIYTLKLRRRGIDIFRGRGANLMQMLTVRDAMRPVPTPLSPDATLGEVIERFAAEGADALPVVGDGLYRGVVPSSQLEEAMRANAFDLTSADLMQEASTVAADQTLEDALASLVGQATSGVAVVNADDGSVSGWLTHRDLLAAYVAHQTGGSRSSPQPTDRGVAPSQAPSGGSLAWLRDFRIVDLELGADAAAVGRTLAQLPLPTLSLPIRVWRNGRDFTPGSETILEAGDRLRVLVAGDEADGLSDRLAGDGDDDPRGSE
jgi:CIC family chloride channel protein